MGEGKERTPLKEQEKGKKEEKREKREKRLSKCMHLDKPAKVIRSYPYRKARKRKMKERKHE